MLTIEKVKKMVGKDYAFHQVLSIDKIKNAISKNNEDNIEEVPVVLEAGNLDIELCVLYNDNGNGKSTAYLGYFCCLKKDGVWDSYNDIDSVVNLDVDSLEDEMLKVLINFAEKEHLKFV